MMLSMSRDFRYLEPIKEEPLIDEEMISEKDNIISELARNALSFPKKEKIAGKILSPIQEKIAQKQADVKEKSQQKIPFSVKFKHQKGNWEESNSNSEIVKQMFFISDKDDNNLFTEFAILGFKKGKIKLVLTLEESNKKHVSNYFSQLGIQIKDSEYLLMKTDKASDRNTMYILCEGKKSKKIFFAIKNSIPKEYCSLIKSLVEIGDWNKYPVKAEPDYFI